MKTADLRTDGTIYRAENMHPIEPYDRTTGRLTVKLLDLAAPDAPSVRYGRERLPIKAEVVTSYEFGPRPGEVVFLSARRVLRTETQHVEKQRVATENSKRWKRELDERNRANTTIERLLKARLAELGLSELFGVYNDPNRANLAVALCASPEKLLVALDAINDREVVA